jgi:hypothetical protein
VTSFIIDAWRDHGAEIADGWHAFICAPSLRGAALLFHHGTVAAHHSAQSTAVTSVFIDDRRLAWAGTLHYLSQATLLQPTRLAAVTSFGIDLKDHSFSLKCRHT